MRETIQKRLLCILLSIAVAVTTFCCNQDVVFASGGIQEEVHSSAGEQESADSSEPGVQEEADLQDEAAEVPKDSDKEETELEFLEMESSEAESEETDNTQLPESEGGELPESEENIQKIENQKSEETEVTEPVNIQEPADIPQNTDMPEVLGQEDEQDSMGLAEPPDHSLAAVYWNPKAENEMSPDGQTYLYGGNDNNTGASVRVPVQTLEKALQRAASDAVIYCMGYYGKYEDCAIDGGFYNVVIKRYTGHKGNILQITNGTMHLSNLILDGSEDTQAAVLAVTSGGELVLGDSVGNVGSTRYLVESEGKTIRLAGRPERDTVYHVRFASGYFNHAVEDVDSGVKEIMLVNASEAGLDPTGYFVIEDLPEGWEVYTKNNRQLWARYIEPYTAIYLNGISGNDSNTGRNSRQAVKTYARAWELYQSKLHGVGKIYITGTVTVSDSLNIERVDIERMNFTDPLFHVTNTGSFTVGNQVIMRETPNETYSIKSSGDLKISASANIGRILLANREKPLVLEGSGTSKFNIYVSNAFRVGDLVVRNAGTDQAESERPEFVLKQQGEDLYLAYPATVYLNGHIGNDSNDGETPDTPVKNLQRALDLALASGINRILVSEAPAQVYAGDTVTIPDGMQIEPYGSYLGNLIRCSGGLLNIQGIVTNGIRIEGSGHVVADNGNVQLSGVSVSGNGILEIGSAGIDRPVGLSGPGNPTVIQNGGVLYAGVSVSAGSYTLNDGTIHNGGVIVGGDGTFFMAGGTMQDNETALKVMTGGKAEISGGTIKNFRTNAILVEDGDVILRGGSIQGREGDVKRSIRVKGDLHIAGDIEITNAIISMEKQGHPLLLETELPAGRVYQMDAGASYVIPGTSQVLVQGDAAFPAETEHFHLAEDAAEELSLSDDAASFSVNITKASDPEGIYLDGTHGNDGLSGEDSVRAVRTFAKAKELLRQRYINDGKEYNIYMAGNVMITGNETWSLPAEQFPWQPKVMRYERWADDLSSPAFMSTTLYGMIHVNSGASLTLEHIILDGNAAIESRYSIIYSFGTLNINEGAVITGNNKVKSTNGAGAYAAGGGGIAAIAPDSQTTLNGGIISNNKSATDAGGISISAGTFTMNSGSIEYNESNLIARGGGISVETYSNYYAEVFINGGTIRYNKTQGEGGGICVRTNQTNTVITGGEISYNEAREGGGIYQGGTDKLEIKGGVICNNQAEIGGGISCESNNFVLAGGEISKNRAVKGGGIDFKGTSLLNNGKVEIKDGLICENTASSQGGGILWGSGKKLHFSGGIIQDNQAPDGEGIYLVRENTFVLPYGLASFGSTQVKQNIKLGDDTENSALLPIKLSSVPTDQDNHFTLEVAGSAYAENGAVVVAPDGDNVTNAAQYLKNFSLNDGSGFTLVKNGDNIILGQAYFVDGVNGDDGNSGSTPDHAFKTVSHAISVLGTRAGAIYICGTVSVPSSGTPGASSSVTWSLQNNQSIIRYSGELTGGRTYEPFTGNMIEVNEGSQLTLNNVALYGALGENSAGGNGYLLVQNGTLHVSEDTSMEYGTVYLKDGKEITVIGDGPSLLMEVEKENAREGDVIARYTGAGAGAAKTENFRLSDNMAAYRLAKQDADTIVLEASNKVYVDGQNGNDSNDGTAPDRAFLTMKKAYQTLQAAGGQIYIVDTVELAQDMELGGLRYQDTNGSITMNGRVQIIRYDQNINPLFLVSSDITTLSGIRLDGSGDTAVGNNSPLVKVGAGGILKVQHYTVLSNNHSSGNGGAIENEGKTELYQCSFRQNQAAKGSAVYQNGSLLVNSPEVNWSESGTESEEIYFDRDKYIDIGKKLPADMKLRINLDPADASEGRVIAEFTEHAYETAGVIWESEHFRLDPSATRRGLAASGDSTLVLAGDFDVSLTGTEFFRNLGSSISFNSVFENARPEDVTITVTKNGTAVPVDSRNYNRFKKITIPVSRENIGELKLSFQYGNAVVEKQIIISGYEIIYAQGQNSLVAKAQEDSQPGIHKDSANVRIYNGAPASREFRAEERSIRFNDRASVEIDNTRVSRDMEPSLAMRYFGLNVAESFQIPANGTADAEVILLNGDLLTADKEGKITLDNASLGNCTSNIELDYKTKAAVRVQVQVRKDSIAVNDATVTLQDASGNVTAMVYRTAEPEHLTGSLDMGLFHAANSRQTAYPYYATGIAPGTYRLYLNGENTGKSITARAGAAVQEEIELFTIQYHLNSGRFNETAPEYYISGIGVDALPQPSYPGHIFGGWYRNDSYTGNVTVGISPTDAEPYTLYAKWEKVEKPVEPEEPQRPAFKVRLQQKVFFEQLGTAIEIKGQMVNAKAEDVTVKVEKLGADGKVKETISAEAGGSGGVKKIIVPLEKETVGTLLFTFQNGKDKVQERVELSGYEVVYKDGRNSILAAAQKDGNTDIHKDTANVRVYNGSLKSENFSIGGHKISYKDGSVVSVNNAKVSKDMKAEYAMKYFGLKIKSFFSLKAGESKDIKVTLSNGDLLTADKKGTILLTDAVLGTCRADMKLSFETQAITRVQVNVKKDDKPVNKGTVTLQDQNGKTITLSQKAGEEKKGTYLKTGISTEKYLIVVNSVDTGRKIQAERGKVIKKNVNFYSIHYELNQGIEKDQFPDYYVQGVGTKLVNPERDGYTFEGWYRTKGFKKEAVTEISKEESGSLKLYAKWKEKLKITARTSVPKTGDGNIIAIDVALMGGMGYLMKMFTSADLGIDEERKEQMLKRMIGKAKGKNLLVRLGTIALITITLLLYYTVGMKKAVRKNKKLQRQQNG